MLTSSAQPRDSASGRRPPNVQRETQISTASDSMPLAGGTPDLPGSAASEFGDAAMARSSCGVESRSCLVHALGTRTVREPLCDCTVLCVGRARTGHGCQSDNYYRCAGSCAVQATGWRTVAVVYHIFRIITKLEMEPTLTV